MRLRPRLSGCLPCIDLGQWCLGRFVGQRKDHVGEPAAEGVVVAELLEELGVVVQDRDHDPGEGFVVLDPGVLLVGVLHGVLKGGVGGDLGGDVLGDELVDAVGVGPGNVAELVVEGLEDVGEPVEFRLGLVAAAASGDGLDLGVLVGRVGRWIAACFSTR